VESGRRPASRVLERPRRLNCHRNFKPLVFRQFQPGVDSPARDGLLCAGSRLAGPPSGYQDCDARKPCCTSDDEGASGAWTRRRNAALWRTTDETHSRCNDSLRARRRSVRSSLPIGWRRGEGPSVRAADMLGMSHRREGQRPSPNGQAPTFETVAKTPGMTAIALTAVLRTSHRNMPEHHHRRR
jgi:hypothetical protein